MNISAMKVSAAPRHWHYFLLVLGTLLWVFSAVTPPFQAPDEFDHISRAYMLGHGDFMLHSRDGKASGGEVDVGLNQYMEYFTEFPGKAKRKISEDELTSAAQLKWTGATKHESPVGTAYYFPLVYLPQAMGLRVGEAMGLTVSQSYRLARYSTIAACLLILVLSFKIFTPPVLLGALLALPMNIFLLASPTLDGLSLSLFILAMSCFMHVATHRQNSRVWIQNVLIISVTLVTSCRANALPFLLVLPAAYYLVQTRRNLIASGIAFVLVLFWTVFSIKTTVYAPGPRHIDHLSHLLSFVTNPMTFYQMLDATLSDSFVRHYYAMSFIGVLGWLDTPLPGAIYYLLGALLAAAAVASLWRDSLSEQRWLRLLLVACAFATLLLTFLAMLVQWTVGDSEIIQGVQGRYFMIPCVAIAYAIAGRAFYPQGGGDRVRKAIVILMLAISTYAMVLALIARFYTGATQEGAVVENPLLPSHALSPEEPITLLFNQSQLTNPRRLYSIDLMFGTYMRSNPGTAALHLWTANGETISIPFDLPSIEDNKYRSFKLDGKPYVGGQVVSTGGHGVVLWQVSTAPKNVLTCTVLHSEVNDGASLTPECPPPN